MQAMNHRNLLLAARLFVAIVIGLSIALTSYLCVYYNQREAYDLVTGEPFTINQVQHALERHREKTGRWPTRLAEVEELKGKLNDNEQFLDPWKYPYHYRVNGDTYELFSLGKDGKPGGEGLDADLYIGHRPAPPSLSQFMFELPTIGVLEACVLSGVCASLVYLLQKRGVSRRSFYLRMGVTMFGAILVAVVISALHIPSGH